VDDALARVAANLRRIREEQGMTQDALAEAASMDAAEIRRIESASRDPGVRVLARLASGLGVPPADLFAGLG
jgi:transcriptional regulator with XRE-family HTH domain